MHNITVDAKENAMFVSSMEVQTLKYRSENLRLCCLFFVWSPLSNKDIRGTEQHRVWSLSWCFHSLVRP